MRELKGLTAKPIHILKSIDSLLIWFWKTEERRAINITKLPLIQWEYKSTSSGSELVVIGFGKSMTLCQGRADIWHSETPGAFALVCLVHIIYWNQIHLRRCFIIIVKNLTRGVIYINFLRRSPERGVSGTPLFCPLSLFVLPDVVCVTWIDS